MTFDLARIIESKRELRRRLAALPIGEKLRMLDMLRERSLAIRAAVRRKAAEDRGHDARGAGELRIGGWERGRM